MTPCAVVAALLVCAQTPVAGRAAQRSPAHDDSLVAAARRRPDEARDRLARLRARAVHARSPGATREALAAAARLAGAYAVAWGDSFPARQVASFTAANPARRAALVTVDSLRRAGVAAVRTRGVPTAMALWRASLARAAAAADTGGRAAALGNLGAGYFLSGQLDSAEAYLVAAHDLAVTTGDLRAAGNALGTRADVRRERGDLETAARLYAQAFATRERVPDVSGMAADRNNLGLLALARGDLAAARAAFDDALALNRRYGRRRGVATDLTNLAGLATRVGDYAGADTLYRDALALDAATGSRTDAADVLHARGLLALRRGDFPAARADIGRALAVYDETGDELGAVAARRDLATALAAMGRLEPALRELRGAERRAAGAPPALLASLAMTRADLAVELNHLADADAAYARAERLFQAAHDEPGRASARRGRGLLLIEGGEYARALALFHDAARAEAAAGDARAAAASELLVAAALQGVGDEVGARHTLLGAAAALGRMGDAAGVAAALAALGELDLAGGRADTAAAELRRGLDALGGRELPDLASRLHAALGEALGRLGESDEAVAELRAAVTYVERPSAQLRLEERRSAYRDDKWSVYARLALAEHARGDDAAAFAASERLRARALLDRLARGRVDAGTTGGADVAREQDLRFRITELTRSMELGGGAGPRLRGPGAGLPSAAAREALDAASREYGELLAAMRERSPQYARMVQGETVGWREVALGLAPDEALVEYLVDDSTSLALVVTDAAVHAVDLHLPRHALAGLVAFARASLADSAGVPRRDLWRAPLARLYDGLVAPIEASGYLAGKRSLVIVPHGELHFVPFAALRRRTAGAEDEYLVARYSLRVVPSASLWVRLPAAARGGARDDVLALAPREAALPGSRAEVDMLRRLYGERATVLEGAAASEAALRARLPRAAIVHLATFGVLNRANPLFSFVDLAPSAADDGLLEVHEVFGLPLRARLVVLSACQTAVGSGALGDVPAGDDWVALAHAFLFAGAGHVMATLWPVDDRATARFMQRFYAGLRAGRTEADALASAQRDAARDPRTAHPFYWAGFVMFARREACAGAACATAADGRGRP
ncbi:MAG: CHAT domain-containing protein [Gemmatimonadaceae bacterium]